MKRSIAGRHFDLTEAIKSYVEAAVDVIDKYNLDITSANTVISKSEKKGFSVEFIVNLKDKNTIVITQKDKDVYAAIDLAIERLKKSLRRHSDKIKGHRIMSFKDMGVEAETVLKELSKEDIDVVIPIPDSGRTAAIDLAHELDAKYREGFIKNRYIGRTFIMPGQEIRAKSVRQKLNTTPLEFKDKNVLLVDDSIVRGTTSRKIVEMAREAGAKKVYFASAAPAVRFPNVYGIDLPAREDLIANNATNEEIAIKIGADKVFYQTLEDLHGSIQDGNPTIEHFEDGCFSGNYITGDIDEDYLKKIESLRGNSADEKGGDVDNSNELIL